MPGSNLRLVSDEAMAYRHTHRIALRPGTYDEPRKNLAFEG